MAGNIQTLLDELAPPEEETDQDTAIFYSISNTQKGLQGVSFGEFLIKRVLAELNRERPQLKTFATLSPAGGFCDWLASATEDELTPAFTGDERVGLRTLTDSDDLREGLTHLLARPGWQNDESVTKIFKSPAMRLCARYLLTKRDDGRPIDSVARFHLKNGARLERINWIPLYPRGRRAQSRGLHGKRQGRDQQRNQGARQGDALAPTTPGAVGMAPPSGFTQTTRDSRNRRAAQSAGAP
jgi:malonyl-CoA decarboxylase